MAPPRGSDAEWAIDGPHGVITVYGVRLQTPAEIYFEWQEEGHERVRQWISRHVTGTPARVLVLREGGRPTPPTVDGGDWVFDPHHEPDSVAAAVLDFINSISVEFLMYFARRGAADDLSRAEDHVMTLSRELEVEQDRLAACRLVEAALNLADLDQVKVGLSLIPDWAGSPDELVLAVLEVTRPVG